MVAGQGPIRATLVEYGAPVSLLPQLAIGLKCDIGAVRNLILGAGERIARLLALPENPFIVTGNDLRVVDVAGLLRVSPRLELEVAPKFLGTQWPRWREDFFFVSMLSQHGRLLSNERLSSSGGARDDLATLVARAMLSMFWENHRRPLRTYRQAAIAEFVIDGEVDPESLFLPLPEGYSQRIVTFDRRNVFNAAILAATKTLLSEVRDPPTRRQLVRVAEVLSPQSSVRQPRSRRLPTRARRWQSLHDLSIDVLRGFGVSYAEGSARAPGFVLNTWRVWEDLLAVALRLSWGAQHVEVQKRVALGVRKWVEVDGSQTSTVAWVRPDLSLSSEPGLLLDAKYKGRAGESRNRVSEADLYEALAFATAAKRQKVVLLFPAIARQGDVAPPTGTTTLFETIQVGTVTVLGMEVEVRGIAGRGALRLFANGIFTAVEGLLNPASGAVPTS